MRKEKLYSSSKFIREFLNKNWSRRGLDHLINLNMLLPDIHSDSIFSKMGHQHIVHVTLSPCCREWRQSLSLQMWPPNSPDLNPVDYSIWGILQERVYRLRIHDVKELKERLLRECRLLVDTIIAAVIIQWHSRLNACVRMNGGHLEHKFWASDFLLCFVCFINTGFLGLNVVDINTCKVLMWCEMCYFCVWDFHTVW